ncbi:MCM7 [Symbiodinium sp. KB8]|nr:MCM7 [Symbiodinium sp. KB8]
MDEADRTAIHEVMEQQTVSIAKAGITTTLNARTAILAAANPLYGRYKANISRDAHENMRKNVNLPAALLSRFDLIFIILDRPDADNDLALARHITYVHQYEHHPELDFDPVASGVFRVFVEKARQLEPYVPKSLTSYIVEQYVALRTEEAKQASSGTSLLTARQLLSILRLAQAHARLRFSENVSEEDVDEAMRLLHRSKASILADAVEEGAAEDVTSRIYNTIRDMALASKDGALRMSTVRDVATRKGFTPEQLRNCIEEYEELGIWQVSADGDTLQFVLANE